MDQSLTDFFAPHPKPRLYEGQSEPAFQQRLQAAHAHVAEEDCHFYHTMELADGEIIDGGWDMRGNEKNYLGHVDLNGLSILECGPASGFLSFWMESQGGRVTALDLPPGHGPDLVPLPGIDLEQHWENGAVTAEKVRNAWWYAHRKRGSSASMVYADIYHMPEDMPRFDISTFGAILLHLAHPFKAMTEAARVTDKAMIVTDIMPALVYGNESNNLVEFNPGNENENLVNWWCFHPAAIERMLNVLGFGHTDIHYFEIEFHADHDPSKETVKRYMYSVVGQREADSLPRLDKSAEELAVHKSVQECIPKLNLDQYNADHQRLQDLAAKEVRFDEIDAELRKIYSSLVWKITKPLRLLFGP